MPASRPAKLPVVILDPSILVQLEVYRPGPVSAVTVGDVSFRNEAMAAVNRIAAAIGAEFVVTHDGTPYDARDQLLGRGLQGRFATDWCVDQAIEDRRTAIRAWLAKHGLPPAIVIERPGIAVPGSIAVTVPDGIALDASVADRAIAAFRRRF